MIRGVVSVLLCVQSKDIRFIDNFAHTSNLLLDIEKLIYLKHYDFFDSGDVTKIYGCGKKICIVANRRTNINYFHAFLQGCYIYVPKNKILMIRGVVSVLLCVQSKDIRFIDNFAHTSNLLLDIEKLIYLKHYDFFDSGDVRKIYG